MGKLYLVTGVSSGIGFATAQLILANKQRVIGVSRNCSDKVKELQANYPDQFIFEAKDLTLDLDKLPRWVLGLSKTHGRFSGFVHAAGVLQVLPLRFVTHQKMLDVFTLNVFSALEIAKGISDKRACTTKGNSIVFISSISATTGSSGIVNYSSSKAALNGAMRSLAKEISSDGFRVNSIICGTVQTEMIDAHSGIYTEEYLSNMEEAYPLGLGQATDIANGVEFLLSDKSKWLTGSELVIDGGISLGVHE
ncbi:SDR family NAD(P)-dependent oxidoreductase [Vibrio breoganii]